MQPGVPPANPANIGPFGQPLPPPGMQGLQDLQAALLQAQQMQQQLVEAQKQIAETQVQGQAGGGSVQATLNGHGQFVSIRIDPTVVDPDDVETLQDLIVVALGDAAEKMRDAAKEILAPVAAAAGRPLPES